MATQIVLRNDTTANWASVNPVLALGEWALDRDLMQFKIGDGSTAWLSLPFRGVDGAPGNTTYEIDLDLGAAPVRSATYTFTHVGVLTTQRVLMQPAAIQPSPFSHDELEDEMLVCAAGCPATDTIRVVVSTLGGEVSGVRRFYYTIGESP